MFVAGKAIITILVVYAVATDADRARRRRRHASNADSQSMLLNSKPEARQQPLPPNPQILNAQGPQPMGPMNQAGAGLSKSNVFGSMQGSRQYYPNQGQYGYGGMQGGLYGQNQYGMGSGYQPNYGQYGSYGSGYGQYGYNQNPGYNSLYSGYNSGSNMNRPGYGSYNPSYGNQYGSGYFWNSGHKSTTSVFTILLTSIFALSFCLITM